MRKIWIILVLVNCSFVKQTYWGQYNKPMMETILQFKEETYPFDCPDDSVNIKLEALIHCSDYDSFVRQKRRFHFLKNLHSEHIIKLEHVYQEALTLHLIYQYIPISLAESLRSWVQQYDGNNIMEEKKQMLQNIAFELSQLCEFLASSKILTDLNYSSFGVKQLKKREPSWTLKYYISSCFEHSEHTRQQLRDFYFQERKKILGEIERDLDLERRSDYLPNFIIRGNKLIFTDDISETKTRKRNETSHNRPKFDYFNDQQRNKKNRHFRQPRNSQPSQKPRKHKYSCNFEHQGMDFDFDENNLNRSFQSEKNETYSVTQTKSMKIQVQQQKPNVKNRKSSIKLKITTFEEISIDNDMDDQTFEFKNNDFTNPPDPQQEGHQKNYAVQEQKAKDYSQKVKQAKLKAQILLNKYLKTKNKSVWN